MLVGARCDAEVISVRFEISVKNFALKKNLICIEMYETTTGKQKSGSQCFALSVSEEANSYPYPHGLENFLEIIIADLLNKFTPFMEFET
jgi:hypothetical protein